MHHRDVLMELSFDRYRPAGFIRFELCDDPPQWMRDLEFFFRHDLIGDDATVSLERDSVMLSGSQAAEYMSEYCSVESIRACNIPVEGIESALRVASQASAWHRFRGRPELCSKYEMIARSMRAVLRETVLCLVPVTPEKEEPQNENASC